MDNVEIKNAVITDVRFDVERGLSVWITLDYGGSGQGFGGYLLYAPKGWVAHNKGGDFTGHFIWRVLETAGVEEWSKLVGCTIRVKATFGKVEAIGHIIKDKWFNPSEEFQQLLEPFNRQHLEREQLLAIARAVGDRKVDEFVVLDARKLLIALDEVKGAAA